eukprot:TRINITY_DN68772_c0_g1_i1.p1 TRINITY_DN68772_c0_g1~~TRINITY_DN68772_c0_g1_i1.p1  ORF type:complete len:393 (+),score=28.04 TRINITY_DN68772_c0_g1_i1:65-1180(+)
MVDSETRLWAVSDIHTDSRENALWVERLSDTDYQQDALVVAGDVSDTVSTLQTTLQTLAGKFKTVFFTPGNHDLWLSSDDACSDSFDKLHNVINICEKLGVATGPRRIGGTRAAEGGSASVWVCPLLSWHHKSFDSEADIEGWDLRPPEMVMNDYHCCCFPEGLSMHDDSVANAIDCLNDARLSDLDHRRPEEPLVTFSHFLPRIELLPEKRFLTVPQLPKASGSRFLGDRVRTMRPAVHIFGHTHFGWDAVHDDVRYVQAALAYPRERLTRWHTLSNGTFGRDGPLLVWSSLSGFAPKRRCRWSGYYEHHQREPGRVFELAHYAAGMYRKTDPRATECTPDFSHEGSNQMAGNRQLREDPALPPESDWRG